MNGGFRQVGWWIMPPRERESFRPRQSSCGNGGWILRIPAWGKGVSESGSAWAEASKTPDAVTRLFKLFMLPCCIVFMGSCIRNNFRKLAVSGYFGNSFGIEIAAEAQNVYFWQTQLHALLKARGSKILWTAYKKRVFISPLIRGDFDNDVLCWNNRK